MSNDISSSPILQPFIDQFRWSRPDAGDKNWDKPFEKHKNNFAAAFGDEDPLFSFYASKLLQLNEDEDLESLSQEETTNLFLEFIGQYPGLFAFQIITRILSIGHTYPRIILGRLGASFEWAERWSERHIENSRLFYLPKLLFYLLKQPFKWAETAISSVFHIVDGLLLLAYSGCCKFSTLWKKDEAKDTANQLASQSFEYFIAKTKPAVGRLILTGLIGVAGYFLGPPAVAALAGTLGTLGAGFAVAGIGTVGVTAIQGVALKITERCLPEPEDGDDAAINTQIHQVFSRRGSKSLSGDGEPPGSRHSAQSPATPDWRSSSRSRAASHGHSSTTDASAGSTANRPPGARRV